ncbi:MAG: hypothetical protein HGN29_04215 [Asgard group archaeon]|nr:hypothetical protein [Asgard group archaeon]
MTSYHGWEGEGINSLIALDRISSEGRLADVARSANQEIILRFIDKKIEDIDVFEDDGTI